MRLELFRGRIEFVLYLFIRIHPGRRAGGRNRSELSHTAEIAGMEER